VFARPWFFTRMSTIKAVFGCHMAKILELTARFRFEKIRFDNDVIIGDAEMLEADPVTGIVTKKTIVLKGADEDKELREGITYIFHGRHTTYQNKKTKVAEPQFAFESFGRLPASDKEGVVSYLISHGEGYCIGRARCTKLWDVLGENAVKIARTQPDEVARVLREARFSVSDEQVANFSAALIADEATETVLLDTMKLLNGRGFPRKTPKLLIKRKEWGARTPEILREDPFRLLVDKIPGCGFKRCDSLYLDLGHDPKSIKRQALAAWYGVSCDSNGNTWVLRSVAYDSVTANVGKSGTDPVAATRHAINEGYLCEIQTSGINGPVVENGSHKWVAETWKSDQEHELAERIAAKMSEHADWPTREEIKATEPRIAEHQLDQLEKAMRGAVCILGGGPGTGKTFCAAALLKCIEAKQGANTIAAAAPTGKAAVRVTENLNRYQLSLRGRTWHSLLLEVEIKELHHFRQRLLLGDETSMNDSGLMGRVFEKLPRASQIILVGDVHQLPPVGHGAPLRDMIAAGVPYGEFTEVQRNSGMIVRACERIRQGRTYDVLRSLHQADIKAEDPLNLVRLEAHSTDDFYTQLGYVTEWAIQKGYDPIQDCQVIAPVGKKGRTEIGCPEINAVLQASLNPNTQEQNIPFRMADKVVNTKNSWFKSLKSDHNNEEVQSNESGEVYVANGELGIVKEVGQGFIVVDVSAPNRTIRVNVGKQSEKTDDGDKPGDYDDQEDKTNTGCSWMLGYCLTVHKSQGSEFPINVVILDASAAAKRVNSREFLYTAISRGKSLTVEIGLDSTVAAMIRRSVLPLRKTFLKEQILMECGRLELASV